jgi:hypothetical protein
LEAVVVVGYEGGGFAGESGGFGGGYCCSTVIMTIPLRRAQLLTTYQARQKRIFIEDGRGRNAGSEGDGEEGRSEFHDCFG